jgi:hypothetical protein
VTIAVGLNVGVSLIEGVAILTHRPLRWAAPYAAFRCHIARVVPCGTEEKMIDIATGRNITTMKNEQAFRDRSMALFPGEVRHSELSAAASDFPVTA